MELLRAVTATVRFPEPGEDEVTLTKPTVTITRDSDGEAILKEAATTTVKAGEGDIAHFTVELKAGKIPECDILKAIWVDGTNSYEQVLEVVGDNVISLAKIEEQLGEKKAEASLKAMREIATREIESACGTAFRPRYAKEQLDGEGTERLKLGYSQPLKLIRIEIEEEPLSEAELTEVVIEASPNVAIRRDSIWPRGKSNIVVAYVFRSPASALASLPVRDYAAYLLTPSPTDWDQRATALSTDVGTYSLVTPGVRGAQFPLPSVNAFCSQFSMPLVG